MLGDVCCLGCLGVWLSYCTTGAGGGVGAGSPVNHPGGVLEPLRETQPKVLKNNQNNPE